jgi:hypothetical protein
MAKLQGLFVLIALIGLGLGYILIRAEALLQGQIAANVGFMALIAILIVELFKGESDE